MKLYNQIEAAWITVIHTIKSRISVLYAIVRWYINYPKGIINTMTCIYYGMDFSLQIRYRAVYDIQLIYIFAFPFKTVIKH